MAMKTRATSRQQQGSAATPEMAEQLRARGIKVEWAWIPNKMQERALLRPEFEVFVGGSKYGGKELSNNSILYAPNGQIRIGDVEVGQELCSPDGGTCSVIGVFPQGTKKMYRITFNDGASVRAGAEHLWLARWNHQKWKANPRFPGDQGWRVQNTRQMIDRIANNIGPNVWQMPLTEPVEFHSSGEILLDPYIFGILLGDGHFGDRNVKITNLDKEIGDALRNVFQDGVAEDVYPGRCLEFRLRGQWLCMVRDALTTLGLMGKRSWEKSIPDVYKYQPAARRWALLQGLMDTDGYADTRGHTSYTSVSKQLAEDVQWLARSLGCRASITSKERGYKKIDGEWVQCRDAYTVWINSPKGNLFRISRKKSRGEIGKKQSPTRNVLSIEEDGEDEATCIAVDHPNQLYLTDDFIVTHNTDLGIMWLIKGNLNDPKRPWYVNGKGIMVNHSYIYHPRFLGAVIRLNEKDLAEWVDRAQPYYEQILGGTFTRNPAECRWPSGARIFLGHAGDSNAWTKYQGQNITRFLIEEAGQIPDLETFDNIRSCCRSADPENMVAQILLTANPGGPGTTWLMDRYIEPKDRTGTPIMHPQFNRPILDSDQGLIRIVEKAENPFTKETVETDRVWVPSYLSDNPIAMKNTAYIATLATMTNEKMRRAYLFGDWKALRGAYYDNFQMDVHTYDPKTRRLATWCKSTGSLDWGYVHETACLWHKMDPDTGQHLIYKEFGTSHTDPVEVGAELARRSMEELRIQETMAFYVSHDLYHNKIGDFTWIELIAKGVERILGSGYCYIPDLLVNRLRERYRTDGEKVPEDLEERLFTKPVQGIVFRRAPMTNPVSWMHIRTLMRTEPIHSILKATPDYQVAMRLMDEGGADAYVKYLKSFEQKKEILPELLISRDCQRLLDAIPKARHSEKNPETIDDKHFVGKDFIDSLNYLLSSLRDEKPEPLPARMEQERILELARKRNPTLTTQDAIWIARNIEARQAEEQKEEQGFSLGRGPRSLRHIGIDGPRA